MKHLRLPENYLTESSVVFDLGGYKGTYSGLIHNICACSIFLFEPVEGYYTHCVNRFKGNDNIKCFNYGLGSNNEPISLYIGGDSSSIYKTNLNTDELVLCEIKHFGEFIKQNEIKHIDLIKINIEGGEYDLLEYLIDGGDILKIGKLQIQFHNFDKNAEKRKREIVNKLKVTHSMDWKQGEWAWEEWSLKQ